MNLTALIIAREIAKKLQREITDIFVPKKFGDETSERNTCFSFSSKYSGLEHFQQVINHLEKDHSIFKKTNNRAKEGQTINYQENILINNKGLSDTAPQGLGNLKQVNKYHEQHLSIDKDVGDRAGEGWSNGNLGNAYQGLGNFKQAVKYHAQDFSIAKELRDRAGEGCAYGT